MKARPHADRMDAAHPMNALGYEPCRATSKQSGQRCKRRPIPGGYVCVMHGGKAPQVQAAAADRLKAMQPKALATLDGLMDREEFPTVQYQAAKAVIDWTEGRAAEHVALEHSGAMVIRHEVPE